MITRVQYQVFNDDDGDRELAARLLCSELGSLQLESARDWLEDRMPAANILEKLARNISMAGFDAATSALSARFIYTVAASAERAQLKFRLEFAKQVLFDSESLQMASSEACAAYHAKLFKRASVTHVHDLTAGIGADTLAFALAGLTVTAFEIDRVRSWFLRANAQVAGVGEKVKVIDDDWMTQSFRPGCSFYLDPPRRSDSSRWGGESIALQMISSAFAAKPKVLAAKLSPAFDERKLIDWGGRLTFISEGGTCKEALFETGMRETRGKLQKQALILPTGATHVVDADAEAPSMEAAPDTYLYEPDPSILSAGAVRSLASELGLCVLPGKSGYLIGQESIQNPFIRGYKILDVAAFQVRAIRKKLTEWDCAGLVIKTRGTHYDPEKLRNEFKLRSTGAAKECTIALVSSGQKTTALFLGQA